MKTVGEIGENLVQQWLVSKNWKILKHRWRSRFGEIDLIALPESSHSLAFIEVKTRSSNNWDADGLLAINHQKQLKLTQTANYFIAKHPKYSDFNCRFDVALVHYKSKKDQFTDLKKFSLIWQNYHFQIQDYLENAFEAEF
ncbi:YraN family protein [Chroococcus sp. FPU101]|uniref:YraN family protein n=1 Tax=Chroococcus sp. FPU101 TaxID=1974212 RepID=UPI001A8F251F|nr:YraN family protein [Chroococcus sp. FPU101]GFE70676.1 protein of unknown function UPF0102 [Chroococcus sp. FPU101]